MNFAAIWAWVIANPAMAAAIGVAFYAFFTKKITFQGLIAEIIKDFTPATVVTPVVGPDTAVIQQLIGLLLRARQSGDAETEAAVIKVLGASKL